MDNTAKPPHQVFIGPTSEKDFLKDGYGDRRWFPITTAEDTRKAYDSTTDAAREVIADLLREFRAADLPYGSAAYEKATKFMRKTGGMVS